MAEAAGGLALTAVVGGGISGIAAAAELSQYGAEVVLLEAGSSLGGFIQTERTVGGALLEHGPDSLLTIRPSGAETIRKLGLESEIIAPEPRPSFVQQEQGLIPLPKGFMALTAPGAWALLRSPLISLKAKARLFLEPWIYGSESQAEESVAAFFDRRLGVEVRERIVEPILEGVYGLPTEELSMLAVMPRLAEMEREFGSLTAGAISRPRRSHDMPPLSSFRCGMKTLVKAYASRIEGTIHTEAQVKSICPLSGRRGYELEFAQGGKLRVGQIILATPAWASARMLERAAPAAVDALDAFAFGALGILHAAWPRNAVSTALEGTGYVVPRRLDAPVSACTWSSQKWEGRAPADVHLVRAFLRTPFDAEEPELVREALQEIRCTLEAKGEPSCVRLHRKRHGLPLYRVGHVKRVQRARAAMARDLPGVALAGNSYDGIGIPDCIRSGVQAARLLGLSEGVDQGP